jgi:hypothetical protein
VQPVLFTLGRHNSDIGIKKGSKMGSESVFTKCKTCGKDVSATAKTCPQCGAKLKKLSVIHWIGIVLLGLMIIGLLNSPDEDSTTNSASKIASSSKPTTQSLKSLMPEVQTLFIQAVVEHSGAYSGAKNELQQSAMRDQRKAAISSTLGGYVVSSWIGTINKLETNSEGKAILSVRVAPDIEIKTWNNALSDFASNTLIEKGTPVFNSLFDLAEGQKVEFSGRFFPSETDFIEETSMTISGSMTNPEFLFQFKSVTKIN